MNRELPTEMYADVDEICPIVLQCVLRNNEDGHPPGHKFKRRVVYDYEIEFFTSCQGGGIYIDDEYVSLQRGDIVFKRPGMINQGVPPYNSYFVCIDLLGRMERHIATYYILEPKKLHPVVRNQWLDTIPAVIRAPSMEKYESLFDRLLQAFVDHSDGAKLLLKSYALLLLNYLQTDGMDASRPNMSNSSPYTSIINKVCGYIEQRLEQPLPLQVLGEVAQLDAFHFHKIFTRHIGMTPVQYITKLRLARAKEMLIYTNKPVTTIAMDCGYANIAYFGYLFKKHVHITPKAFRKKYCEI